MSPRPPIAMLPSCFINTAIALIAAVLHILFTGTTLSETTEVRNAALLRFIAN